MTRQPIRIMTRPTTRTAYWMAPTAALGFFSSSIFSASGAWPTTSQPPLAAGVGVPAAAAAMPVSLPPASTTLHPPGVAAAGASGSDSGEVGCQGGALGSASGGAGVGAGTGGSGGGGGAEGGAEVGVHAGSPARVLEGSIGALGAGAVGEYSQADFAAGAGAPCPCR